jgi:hypothetical protein
VGRLGGGVLLSVVTEITRMYEFDLSAYPRWLVIAVATLIIGIVVWIGIKVMKLALWLLLIAVLLGGFGWALWELFH